LRRVEPQIRGAKIAKRSDICGGTPLIGANAGSGFVVDFACYEVRLIVEVDRATHSTESEIARDERRGGLLRANGNSVLRFTNDEVLS
jgi:hypothetical protein